MRLPPPHPLAPIANVELAKIAEWFKANKLTLNASKTNILFRKNDSLSILNP